MSILMVRRRAQRAVSSHGRKRAARDRIALKYRCGCGRAIWRETVSQLQQSAKNIK
jgi:hypothetical protein